MSQNKKVKVALQHVQFTHKKANLSFHATHIFFKGNENFHIVKEEIFLFKCETFEGFF